MNCEIRDDFIGIFDNVFSDELCDKYIKYFENCLNENLTHARNVPSYQIADRSADLISAKYFLETNIQYVAVEFLAKFWTECYPRYNQKFSILQQFDKHNIFDVKIQKTMPGEGYHSWHTEAMHLKDRNRIMAFMLYLNDVDDGGETEFLYQKVRFKPTKDRLLIWPAGYTHPHRGNPPLSTDKYVITGWIEYGV
jgi:hypothetical protein